MQRIFAHSRVSETRCIRNKGSFLNSSKSLHLPFGIVFHIARKGADQCAAILVNSFQGESRSDNSMPCSAAPESSPFVMRKKYSGMATDP